MTEPGTSAKERNVQVFQMSGGEVEITATREGKSFPEMLVLTDDEAKALRVALARIYTS